MHVSLTPKLEQIVRKKVKSGLYNNASEVIREALRQMAAADTRYNDHLDRLREALAEGERSGFIDDFSMDDLIAELDAESLPKKRAKAARR